MSLTPGQRYSSQHGISCEIGRRLAEGGQGAVFLCNYGGEPHALKWYHPSQATRTQYELIAQLIVSSSPSGHFAWPLDLLVGAGGFGYIMPLIRQGLVTVHELVHRPVPITCAVACRFTVELAQAFRALHLKGLCYRDVSDNNIFVNPRDGSVRIIDNDNVAPVGQPVGVIGTPGFMAPEVVRDFSRNQAVTLSSLTDYHSLATLLFHVWACGHPLYGTREAACGVLGLPDIIRLTGTDPLFVFHQQDRRNRPQAGHHDGMIAAWPLAPPRVRDLFTKAFTIGLTDPAHRITEREWVAAASEAEGHLYSCATCSETRFYDLTLLKQQAQPPCPGCRSPMPLPPRIRMGEGQQHHCDIMLTRRRIMLAWQVDAGIQDPASPAGQKPVAEVVESARQPGLWGLMNLSTETWNCSESGAIRECRPGHAVALVSDLCIVFGPPGSNRLSGRIKA